MLALVAPIQQALDIQLYQNLSFYPKWQAEDDEEEPTADYSIPEATAEKPSAGKRTIGRLRAQGVDVQDLLHQQKKQKWELKQKAREQAAGSEIEATPAPSVTESGEKKTGKSKKQEKRDRNAAKKANGHAGKASIPAAVNDDVDMADPDLEAAMNG